MSAIIRKCLKLKSVCHVPVLAYCATHHASYRTSLYTCRLQLGLRQKCVFHHHGIDDVRTYHAVDGVGTGGSGDLAPVPAPHVRQVKAGTMAAADPEVQPLFKLSMSIYDSVAAPVCYKSDVGRGFKNDATIKVAAGQEYTIRLELDDLGRTITEIKSLSIDGTLLALMDKKKRVDEQSTNNVFLVSANWTPAPQKTAKGARDEVLFDLLFSHGTLEQSMQFQLQMKIYDSLDKARSGGYNKWLKAAVCRYDQAKSEMKWAMLEDMAYKPPDLRAQDGCGCSVM
eukprot:1768347-Pleurochrysis_carterae.AAC.2